MLIGQYSTKLNVKGRVALPVKFREKLGKNVIVARWYEGCLVIVAQSKWLPLLDRLTGKTEFITKPVRDTDRFILGSAYEIGLDSQGRFVIPKYLRDYAKLENEVVFMGLGDRVEVWDKSLWEQKEKQVMATAEKLIDEMATQARKVVGST